MNFILATWLKSNRSSISVRGIDSLLYYDYHQTIIKGYLDRAFIGDNVSVAVACDPDNEKVLYSYAVIEEHELGNILHFIYTKGPFRKLGFAKEILEGIPLAYKTTLSLSLPSYLSHLQYNPYLLNKGKQ